VSYTGIIAALASGPKSTAQLLEVTGASSAYVSRDCARLIERGRIVRIDGTSGRGSRAVYALAGKPVPPQPPGPPSGAELAQAVRNRAAQLRQPVRQFAAALSSDPLTWLDQVAIAQRPKAHTVARIEALLAGQPVPPAPPNNFQRQRVLTQRPFAVTIADRDMVRSEPLPPIVERDPCFLCGIRADIGCRHQKPGLAA
jgi:hypothetical protein